MIIRQNKRGWIRITEAVVAILIMASVLIVLYTNKTPQVSFSSYVDGLQLRILGDISSNSSLRNYVLASNDSYVDQGLRDFINTSIPSNFNFEVRVCNLSATSCLLGLNLNQEIFVEDRIISSNLTTYSPKMLRLFVWEKLR